MVLQEARGGGRGGGRGTGRARTKAPAARLSSFARMASTAGLFLVGLGTRAPLSLSGGWHRRTSDGAQAFSGLASASTAVTMAVEVQSNGEIAEVPVASKE
ncbi:unnamed protein product, partial [Laminaria digitata]